MSLWSYATGKKGFNRVRVYERQKHGPLHIVTDSFMERHLLAGVEDALVERFVFPEDRLFEHELPCEPLCGVYFLLDTDDSVLYVGQSRDILARVSAHRQRSPFQFARCAYQPFEREDLARAESFYIHRFQPPENVRIPPVRAGDMELIPAHNAVPKTPVLGAQPAHEPAQFGEARS